MTRPGILYEGANLKVSVDFNLVSLGAAVAADSQDAAEAAANKILEYANTIVPYKTGLLQSTGEVVRIPGPGTNSVMVVYGTVYAARLHEHPEYHFENGREGKWLEKALTQAGGPAMAAMVAQISKSFIDAARFSGI